MSRSTSHSKTRININYSDPETAQAILRAVAPDNIQVSKDIILESKVVGTMLQIDVDCLKSLGSLVATLDDLLSCIQAAEKAISNIV